ncbi:PAAR-like protein [Clostridium sp. HBUAS56010]|uniref:PAAR-like protein n=1 Tax=Clostridium sp. HBUAS56010 TaxID=2571127 RepID=UPI001177DC52|nr:PAAR-like protein [Clostridium sp. HBUAS56010]
MSTTNKIGDFVWVSDSKRNKKVKEKEQQEQYLELMYMHQQYNGIISKQKYALRGSKLSCSYGSDYSLFDIDQDHGIYKGKLPVMTTIDSGKTNIYYFGSCLCSETNYAGRLPMTAETLQNRKKAKKATNNKYTHICVPMVPEGSAWKQVDHSINEAIL